MKELLKSIGKEFVDRVIVSHKSTIISWLLAGAVVGADKLLLAVANWHSPYANTVALLIGLAGTALKNKAAVAERDAQKEAEADSAPDAPKGFVGMFLLAALAAGLTLALLFVAFAPTRAHAQDSTPPAAAPLAVQLTSDLSLRLNVSVLAGSYDLTHKAWLGQAPITGLYALTSKKLLEAGVAAGGSLTFDSSSRPSGEINAGIVSPKIVVSPTLALHAAVLYGRRFGPDAASLIRVCPTLEF